MELSRKLNCIEWFINEIYNKNGFVVLDKFIEYETSLILFHHVMMSARRAKYAQVNEPDLFDDEKQHYGYFDKCGCLSKPVWNKYADGVVETVLSLAPPMIEEIAEEYDGKVKVGKVDVDQNQNTAMKYGIRSIPTLLVMKNGEVVNQIVGAVPKGNITEVLNEVI